MRPLPADLTSLTTLQLDNNPVLKTLVLSEQLAATGLADEVAFLRGQGVSVYLYPSLPVEEVSIPDPGLNAVIREALGKPAGPLTVQDLLGLTSLDAGSRGVSSLEGLGAAHNLIELDLGYNQLTHFTLAGLTNLKSLYLAYNQLTSLTLPANLTALTSLGLGHNQLTNLSLPAGLTNLTWLGLDGNQLADFSFLSELTSLTSLDLRYNQLTNLTLPAGLTNLTSLSLGENQLSSLTLPAGLTNLTWLGLFGNLITNLTLPAGLTSLTTLDLGRNPLKTFVLPEQLAATGLADEVAFLTDQGVSVYAYPEAVSLVSEQRMIAGAFEFTLTGPPGAYTILGSTDLTAWSELGTLTNELGRVVFTDSTVTTSLQNFYQARSAP